MSEILKTEDQVISRLIVGALFSGDTEEVLLPNNEYRQYISNVTGSSFLIYDQFCIDRDRDEIDGTSCDPTGIRDVEDPSSNLYIYRGRLNMFNQSAWDTYVYFYQPGSVTPTRVAGMRYEFDITPTVQGYGWVGVGTSAHAIHFNNGNLILYNNGAAIPPVPAGVYALQTTYRVRFVLKNAGADFYISGGAFGTLGEEFTSIISTDVNSDDVAPNSGSFNMKFWLDRVLVARN